MTIQTALKKVDKLTEAEVIHCLQRMRDEIANYKKAIENYPPERMKKYGIPYLIMLETQERIFYNRLYEFSVWAKYEPNKGKE